MAQKKLPNILSNSALSKVLLSSAGIVVCYWVFQGIRYMDTREKILKIAIDAIITFLLVTSGINLFFSLILAHTANMFVNGHFYVLKKNIGRGWTDPKYFIEYIDDFNNRLCKTDFLVGAAAYGSLSRNKFTPSSDFDVRIFPQNSFIGWIRAVFWVFVERSRAVIGEFPLDIYAFDLMVIDRKMRSDEPPIVMFDPNGLIAQKYICHVPFEHFLVEFKKVHVPN